MRKLLRDVFSGRGGGRIRDNFYVTECVFLNFLNYIYLVIHSSFTKKHSERLGTRDTVLGQVRYSPYTLVVKSKSSGIRMCGFKFWSATY